MTTDEFQAGLNALPDLDIYKERLDQLKSSIKAYMTQDEIKKEYHEKAGFYTHPIAASTPKAFNAVTFYRVRLNIPDSQNVNLVHTHSYPDPAFCSSNGRANLRLKTVFYCAEEFMTALLECKPKAGDTGYVSIWISKAERPIYYSALFPADMNEKNRWNSIAEEHVELMRRVVEEQGGAKTEQLAYLFRFNSDLYTKEQPPYLLTSWMANSILYDLNYYDLILYPSYLRGYATCNFAFHPNYVDKNMGFECCFKFIVDEVNSNNAKLRFGQMGELPRSTMIWNSAPHEIMQKYFPGSTPVQGASNPVQ